MRTNVADGAFASHIFLLRGGVQALAICAI
jgi:hypothetical protein